MQEFIIGYAIRQRRRAQNLTQSQLGGNSFSKSYVSAVENDKLTPSIAALKYFACRLGEAEDYFVALLKQNSEEISGENPAQIAESNNEFAPEKAALLDVLLEQTDYTDFQVPETFFTLSTEILHQLSVSKQTHYHFLRGIMLQRRADYAAAIEAFEQALVQANHPSRTAAALNELGKCYLLMDLPRAALCYTSRAHQIVKHEAPLFATSLFPFSVELQCANACLALGMYRQALEHFEQARVHLSAQQNIQDTCRLYEGLGYCTYTLAYQQAYTGEQTEEVEHQFQRALSYLLQSCTLAQMGGDVHEVQQQNLTLAMVQLDLSVWRRRYLKRQDREISISKELLQANISSLLDNAGERCRQVLLSFYDGLRSDDPCFVEQKCVAYYALALLIRTSVQKALLAYENGYDSLFRREQSFAATLCQQTLDAYQNEGLLETLLWKVGRLPEEPFAASLPAPLPTLPDRYPHESQKQNGILLSLAEVYWAAGEVAEMLGHTAHTPGFSNDAYTRADACFPRALAMFSQAGQHYDGGFMTRAYQQYTSLLEERLSSKTAQECAGQVASVLITLCKQRFALSSNHQTHSFLLEFTRTSESKEM